MKPVSMAFQGIPGAYSHEAIEHFGSKYEIVFNPVPSENFPRLFENIQQFGLGIVPIDNSTAGVVPNSMDELLRNDMTVIGEYYLPIRHNLLGKGKVYGPEPALRGKSVHSHPHAINQCADYIKRKGMSVVLEDDTAGSALLVSQMDAGSRRNKHFAIASRKAAELYDLTVIEEDINDLGNNTTRFLVVKPAGNGKTVVEESVAGKGGHLNAIVSFNVITDQLVEALGIVRDCGYKINSIQNRPSARAADPEGGTGAGRKVTTLYDKGRIFQRAFYVDIGYPQDGKCEDFDCVLGKVSKTIGSRGSMKLYGIFPKADVNEYRFDRIPYRGK